MTVTHVERSRSPRSTTMRIDGPAVTSNDPDAASHAVALTIDEPPGMPTGVGLT
ncbi:Uncharacterised protein [Mycobacteroides abscessus]|nr:Uncharacterised protein [Mycobacteroides abscessus]